MRRTGQERDRPTDQDNRYQGGAEIFPIIFRPLFRGGY